MAKRILIGFDGSDLACRAAERAVALFAPRCEFTVVTVVPVLTFAEVAPFEAPLAGVPQVLEEEVMTERVEQARAIAQATVEGIGIAAKVKSLPGDPGPELCRLASESHYDVLVVGSHGSGFLKRVVLGSVSAYVLRHAPCPVLVVRDEDAVAGTVTTDMTMAEAV